MSDTTNRRKGAKVILAVVLVAGILAAIAALAAASRSFVGLEAESGAGASEVANSDASGGKAIVFKSEGGGNSDIKTVSFYGNSLMSPKFSTHMSANLSANGMSLKYMAQVGGASIANANNGGFTYSGKTLPSFSQSQASWKGSDAMVINYGINSDMAAATFESEVRKAIATIGSVSPDTLIVWVEAHSCDRAGTTGAQTNVQNRWKSRNPITNKLKTEGIIDAVVPWAAYAAANGDSFYIGDCVHHYDGVPGGNQKPYTDQIQATLNNL